MRSPATTTAPSSWRDSAGARCSSSTGCCIGLTHGDLGLGGTTPERARGAFASEAVAAVLFGHSHAPLVERVAGGPLLVNPGSPTDKRAQPRYSWALVEIDGGAVRAELRLFDDRSAYRRADAEASGWPNFHPGALRPEIRGPLAARFPPVENLALEWPESAFRGRFSRSAGATSGLTFPAWEFGNRSGGGPRISRPANQPRRGRFPGCPPRSPRSDPVHRPAEGSRPHRAGAATRRGTRTCPPPQHPRRCP